MIGANVVRPFPGLRPFRMDEADIFFGREGQSDGLVRKLAKRRFLAVVGASGGGKSSLVKAGLLPALLSGYLGEAGAHWRFAELRPGSDPIGNLSRALAAVGFTQGTATDDLRENPMAIRRAVETAGRDGSLKPEENLLVLADQFEELFTYEVSSESAVADRDEKALFVKLLLEAFRQKDVPVYVAITMRSDYLGDCARFRDLPEEINESQFLTPRLTREQRRSAIEGPIRAAGASIDAMLVQTLLNEIGDDPDQLPVLQHALMRTWDRWLNKQEPHDPEKRHDQILLDDYNKIGRLENALSQHAGEALREIGNLLGPKGEDLVKRVFLLLRERDPKRREVRRPQRVSQLAEATKSSLADVQTVIRSFAGPGRTFLFVSDPELKPEADVDITHESLLRKWKALATEWVPEERESARIYMRLAERAAEQTPGSPDYLSGAALAETVDWWEKRKPHASWAQRYHPGFEWAEQFLTESRRAERDRKRKGLALRGVAIAAVVALLIVGVLYLKNREKSKLTLTASTAALASIAGGRLEVSALIAANSLRGGPNLEASVVLAKSLAIMPEPIRQDLDHPDSTSLVYSADGQFLASGDDKGRIVVWRTGDGRKVREFSHQGGVNSLVFSGSFLLSGGKDGSVQIWSPEQEQPLKTLACAGEVGVLVSDPSGETMAAICSKEIRAWQNLPNWNNLKTKKIPQPVASETPEPSGELSAQKQSAAGPAVPVPLLALAVGKTKGKTKEGLPRYAVIGSFEPEDRNSPSIVFVREEAERSWRQKRFDWAILDLQFDPSDTVLHLLGTDGRVRSWDYDSNSEEAGPRLFLESVGSANQGKVRGRSRGEKGELASFSPDAEVVLAASQAGMLTLWKIPEGPELARVIPGSGLLTLAVRADGLEMAAAVKGGGIRRWSRANTSGFKTGRAVNANFSSDGRYLVTRSPTGGEILDMERRRQTGWKTKATGYYAVCLSPDARQIVVRELSERKTPPELMLRRFTDGTVGERLWPRGIVPGSNLLSTPIFSSDGRYLAAFARRSLSRRYGDQEDQSKLGLYVWETSTGKQARFWPEVLSTVSTTFGPDDRAIYLRGSNGVESYEIPSGQVKKVPPKLRRTYGPMALSPDRKYLAAADDAQVSKAGQEEDVVGEVPGLVRIWKCGSWEELPGLNHAQSVVRLVFSHDSRLLLTAGSDEVVRLWDWRTGKEVTRVYETPNVLNLAFTPSNRIAIAQDREVSVHAWKVKDLLDETCKRVTRNLTEQEWKLWLPDVDYVKTCKEGEHP